MTPQGKDQGTESSAPPDFRQKIEKVLKANLVNLARKVSEGKILTPFEIELLKAESTGKPPLPEFAKNRTELAELLGIARKSIQRYCKEKSFPKARSDGRWPVKACAAWIRQKHGETDSEEEGITQAQAKAAQILKQNEKLDFQLQVMKQTYVPRATVRRLFTQFVNSAKTRSFGGIARMVTLIRLAADTTAACEVCRKEIVEIWHEMESSEWMQQSNPPTDKTG